MDLLQYSFTLDPDHPMRTIRDRVTAKRHLLNDLPGLRWKAWLISEPLPGRMQPKNYAPLYLFDDTQATHAFLAGNIYRAVTDAFGWTRPHHGQAIGPRCMSITGARSCALHLRSLRDHDTLRQALEAPGTVVGASRALPAGAMAVGTVSQLDIGRMELRHYTFFTGEAKTLAGLEADLVYEVVDVSCPSQAR